MIRCTRTLVVVATVAAVGLVAALAAAAPTLRHQADQRGDVAVFGSTLAFDCGAGVLPPAGALVSCASQTNTADTAPDLYWRDNTADATITPLQARTSATLVLPDGAEITYARLYWAALKMGAEPDKDAVLDWLYGPQETITADAWWAVPSQLNYPLGSYYYQASGDATEFVRTWGAGDFRVSDVDAVPLANPTNDLHRAFSAWTLVVFYTHPGEELRNLALFDGFEWIDPGLTPPKPSVSVVLTGFLVPDGFFAKMTAFMYEGDQTYTGDHFTVNGTRLFNAMNPVDDFFNATRSYLGTPVSGDADVPKLSGEPGSMAGYDLDTVDVTALLTPGDTQVTVGADSSADIFMLGGFVTSIASLAPNFGQSYQKTVTDLNGGAAVQGDVLEYTITFTNSGNDPSLRTVLTDVLEAGLTFVPGSIKVGPPGALAAKTDAAGDDEAEYVAATRTLTVRAGTGATAAQGGSLAVNATIEVRFRATIAIAQGQVANQSVLKASGQSGGTEKTYRSDGDPTQAGEQPTVVVIAECDEDADCPAARPRCDLTTHTCGPCQSDANCHDPTKPACQPNGTCNECSATNDARCHDPTPVCNVTSGTCVLCTPGPQGDASECVDNPDGTQCVPGAGTTTHCGCFTDPDCGDGTSGRVCDANTEVCIDGCRGTGGNGCPVGFVCTSTDTSIGTCRPEGDQLDGGATDAGGTDDGGIDPNATGMGFAGGGCDCTAAGAGAATGGGALFLVCLLGLGLVCRGRRLGRGAR
ncbi:MAG TPA: isopeptide-forming domain-containing fimbrial protein [Polyangia bacterium]|jgi:uncharacterized repeat protein (TIGR01451 family)